MFVGGIMKVKEGKNRYLEAETEEEGWTCVGGRTEGKVMCASVLYSCVAFIRRLIELPNDETLKASTLECYC